MGRLKVNKPLPFFWVLLICFLMFPGFSPTPLFSQTENITVDETPVSIRVDGHLDDWPSARMIELDQLDQVVIGKILWKGKDDFNGRFFLCYDAKYLYLAALVQKSSQVTNENSGSALWNGDCLELFLSTDPSFQTQKRPRAGDYHIGFSPGTRCRNPQIYCFNKDCAISGARLVARKTKMGYLMEACLPLDFFKGLENRGWNDLWV